MIRAGTYCSVSSRKGLKGSTLEAGDYVYVTDLRVAPVKKDDPYLQRVFVMVVKVDSTTGYHEIPDNKMGENSNEHKIYMVDPRKLSVLPDDEAKRMVDLLNKAYDKEVN